MARKTLFPAAAGLFFSAKSGRAAAPLLSEKTGKALLSHAESGRTAAPLLREKTGKALLSPAKSGRATAPLLSEKTGKALLSPADSDRFAAPSGSASDTGSSAKAGKPAAAMPVDPENTAETPAAERRVFPKAEVRYSCSGFPRRLLAAFACACMLALAGCTADLSFESTQSAPAVLPAPDTGAMTAPIGDSRARYSIRATLYYRTSDGQLSSALRLIHVDPEDDPLRLIVESLLETPYSSSGLLPIAPAGTRLNGILFSGGVATVDLSAEALSEGEEHFYLARAAIAKTLLSREEIRSVNVLVEGRAAEAGGMPLGALTQQDANAATSYVQLLSEHMLLEDGEGFVERDIVLYLPTSGSGPLLPVSAAIRLEKTGHPAAVLGAFAQHAAGLFPQEMLLNITAETGVTPAGERVLTLRLPAGLAEYDPESRLIPALIRTFCAFMPNIDAARAFIGQESVLQAGGFEADGAGLFDPELFDQLVGSSVRLYFAAQDGALSETEQVIPGSSPSARSLFAALIAGPAQGAPEGLLPVFPETALREDLLGVRIEDGVAHLNLSSELYCACQALPAEGERALVYSIVNTLVYNLDTVLRVQFYIDGAVAETFAGSISIQTPLMANPGLVR